MPVQRDIANARYGEKIIMAFSSCSHCRVELDTRRGALQKCFTFTNSGFIEVG